MQHLAAAVGGKHAVGAQRDEYAVQPRFQQRVRRTAQARIVRNGHAGQQLRLYAVGLESVEPAQHGAELLRLGRGYGVGKDRRAAVFRHPSHRFRRQIGVQHHHLAAVQQLAAALQHLRREMVVNVHVRHRQLHVAALVVDEEVGGGVPAGDHRRLGNVYAQLAAHRRQLLGVHIVAESREQPHVQPQQAHVVGDVAPHAAGAHAHGAGV